MARLSNYTISPAETPTGSTSDDVRERIVSAAIDLLSNGGRDALTTRAVAAAAGVQAPTIYRLFDDKEGLLDAVAEYGFNKYLQEKEVRKTGADPLEDLRVGWNLHIGFGLANPVLYSLMYGTPRPGVQTRAATTALHILHEHVRRIAVAGRLKVSEAKAARLIHASGCGTVFTLLALPEAERELRLSEAAREMVITAITTDAPVLETLRPATASIALRAVLPNATSLTPGERHLLEEWLDRLAADDH